MSGTLSAFAEHFAGRTTIRQDSQPKLPGGKAPTPISKKIAAEFIGTFWLVLGGCGSAVLAAGVPDVGIGYLGVALAFGLTVVTGAYAFGHISGGHFNPVVSFGVFVAGRMSSMDMITYWVAQILGGIAAGGVLYLIASGGPGFDAHAG